MSNNHRELFFLLRVWRGLFGCLHTVCDCRRGDNIIHEGPSLIRFSPTVQCTKEAEARVAEIIQVGAVISDANVVNPCLANTTRSFSSDFKK